MQKYDVIVIINPRRACAAWVTLVVLCVSVCVSGFLTMTTSFRLFTSHCQVFYCVFVIASMLLKMGRDWARPTLFQYKWVVWVSANVCPSCWLVVFDIHSCQTVILQFAGPFEWFSLLFFFFLGSLFSRAAPSWQHMYTKGSWVLQIQVWIKVIRSCKAVFTNNTVTLIIECCEVGCCLKITVGYSVQPSAADEDSPLGGWFSGARRLICHIGTYKRHFFMQQS